MKFNIEKAPTQRFLFKRICDEVSFSEISLQVGILKNFILRSTLQMADFTPHIFFNEKKVLAVGLRVTGYLSIPKDEEELQEFKWVDFEAAPSLTFSLEKESFDPKIKGNGLPLIMTSEQLFNFLKLAQEQFKEKSIKVDPIWELVTGNLDSPAKLIFHFKGHYAPLQRWIFPI
jgi:hypothetical protein